jgi:hypothetical protein
LPTLTILSFLIGVAFCQLKDAPNEASQNATVIKVDDCLLLYIRGSRLSQVDANGKQSFQVALPSLTSSGSGSVCTNQSLSSTVVLEWNDDVPMPVKAARLQMVFNVTRGSRNWKLVSAQFGLSCSNSSRCNDTEKAILKDSSSVGAPMNMSFHCNKVSLTGSGVTVTFDKLQVQPFLLRKGKFAKATDCMGFFTIGVWSSLFVSLVLLAILTFGIVMLADISTMDRFDDPKSKGLQIHSSGTD